MSGTITLHLYHLPSSNVVCTEFPCEQQATYRVERTFSSTAGKLVEFHIELRCAAHLASCVRNHASASVDRILVGQRPNGVAS